MADFTMRPDFVITEAPTHKTLISEFENGVEQRRSKWNSPLRKWTLDFRAKTQAEFETVRDFFNTKKGIICGLLKAEVDKSFLKRRAVLRPEFHPTSLSPQLARAAINLTGKTKGTLLDPFCGSGGILIEAGVIGFKVTGFDIDRIMINRARINLEYYKIKNYNLIIFDATKLKKKYDCIVTDLPYGRNSKITSEIKTLYKEFLKAAYNSTDSAVILFPDFVDYKKLLGKWKEVSSFDYYLHKSLSKRIVVLGKYFSTSSMTRI